MHWYTQVVVSQKRWSFTGGVSQKRDYCMMNSIISLFLSLRCSRFVMVTSTTISRRWVYCLGTSKRTTSFANSTGIAVVELTNRALCSVHVCSSNVCIFVIFISFFYSLPPLAFSSKNV